MIRFADFDDEATTSSGEGTIVIRIGFDGSFSVEVLASESTSEDILCRRLRAAAPILEQLQGVMRTQYCELTEVVG